MTTPSMVKVTRPVGVPASGGKTTTVAVKTSSWPCDTGFAEAVTTAVVTALLLSPGAGEVACFPVGCTTIEKPKGPRVREASVPGTTAWTGPTVTIELPAAPGAGVNVRLPARSNAGGTAK